jgi:hypothetical protein
MAYANGGMMASVAPGLPGRCTFIGPVKPFNQ